MTGGGSQSTYGAGTGSDPTRSSYSSGHEHNVGGTQDLPGGSKGDTGTGYTGSRETGATGVLKLSCVLEQQQQASKDPAQVRCTVLCKPGNTGLHANGTCSFADILRGGFLAAGAMPLQQRALSGTTAFWSCSVLQGLGNACLQTQASVAN